MTGQYFMYMSCVVVRGGVFTPSFSLTFFSMCCVGRYFGSVGSFWGFKPLQGAYVAHPPPLDGIVTAMAKVRLTVKHNMTYRE
jgi:hypothetical protein